MTGSRWEGIALHSKKKNSRGLTKKGEETVGSLLLITSDADVREVSVDRNQIFTGRRSIKCESMSEKG